jgi:hypothetical protein
MPRGAERKTAKHFIIDERAKQHGPELLAALEGLLETADLDPDRWHEMEEDPIEDHCADTCRLCVAQEVVRKIRGG